MGAACRAGGDRDPGTHGGQCPNAADRAAVADAAGGGLCAEGLMRTNVVCTMVGYAERAMLGMRQADVTWVRGQRRPYRVVLRDWDPGARDTVPVAVYRVATMREAQQGARSYVADGTWPPGVTPGDGLDR
jgi:hypothetical protein